MPWPSGLSSEYWSYLQYYCKERKQNLSGFFGREMTKSLGTVERGAFEGLKTEEVFHLCGRKLLIDIVPFWTPPVFVLFCCTFLQRHFRGVAGIAICQPCRRVHFLDGSDGSVPKDPVIGACHFFANGEDQLMPIIYDQNVRDRWSATASEGGPVAVLDWHQSGQPKARRFASTAAGRSLAAKRDSKSGLFLHEHVERPILVGPYRRITS